MTLRHEERETVTEDERSSLHARIKELEQTLVRLSRRERELYFESERKDRRLRERTHYARSLLEASFDPLVAIGPTGKLLDVNRATEEATGRERAVLIGTDFANYFSDPARARAGYLKVLAESRLRDYPLRLLHTSGRMTDVLYNGTLFRDESGFVQGVIATARDITAQKRATEALCASEANLRRAQEIAHIGSWHFDGDPGCTTWSDEVLKILQVPPGKQFAYEDFIGSIHPDDLPSVLSAWEATLKGAPFKLEHRVLVNGECKWLRGTAEVRFDERGNLCEGLGTIQDITERKKAEEALRQSEERFYNAFEHAPIGMALVAPDGRWLRVNRALVELLGRSPTRLQSLTVMDTTHPSDRQTLSTALASVLAGECGSCHLEMRYVHERGGDVYALSAFSLLRDEAQEPLYFIGQMEDITPRKKVEAQLRRHREHLESEVASRTAALSEQTERLRSSQAALEGALEELRCANDKLRELDRLKSMFIATMSHELRTPLNSVIGFTGVILQGLAGPINTEQRKQLGMVKSSAAHLLELINDVIDISKVEAGLVELSCGSFDAAELARQVAASFATAVQGKKLSLVVDAPERVTLTGDERRTRQIVMNLVSNAVKYSDAGSIEVRVRALPEAVEIGVTDTGIGIDARDLERLFRPFSQIHTEGRPKEGSGLGLYLSRKIAELLGGTLDAESRPHEGSQFRVRLPVCPKPASEAGMRA